MQHRTFRNIAYYFAFGLLTLFLFSPVILKFCTNSWDENGLTFLRPLLICSAIVSSCLLVKHRALSIIVFTVFAFTTICEWVMVSNYGSYMDIDLFIAFATTNWEEGTHFAINNLHALWYIIPILLLFVALCILYVRSVLPTLRVRVTTWVICISVAMVGIVPIEKFSSMHHISDLKIALFKNIFTTPPLNIFHLSKIAVWQIQRSKQTNNFSFQSVRTQQVAGKEVYVLAIGESVRYANCSLNGIYTRETMPQLTQQSNLLFYHDYYTSGCTTSTSVPMIITRATAEDNALSYQERSIIQVFKENGFTTAVVQRGLFAQPSSAYLYQGVDLMRYARTDAEVIQYVDKLAEEYDKLFVMFQLRGSHFYYDNFSPEFNTFRPNNIHDKDVVSDSLFINAYDNTILYADHLLSSMIDSLKTLQATAAVWYVSDHGQTITATQGWHGTVCDENEYHVPFFVWYSDMYGSANMDMILCLQNNVSVPINSDNIFYTICGMTHIELPSRYAQLTWDISSTDFAPHPRKLLVGGRVVGLDEQ